MKRKQRGSAIITTPLVIAIGMLIIAMLMVSSIKIIMPYIWYEKLSSTCMKYVFIMEEYGYLTKKEGASLLEELTSQCFEKNKITIDYTAKKVHYGDEIFLKVTYNYPLKLPMGKEQLVPMQIEKYSVCKR